MQVVKKIFILLLVSWCALVLFMPKQNLYYKLEQMLVSQDIKINEGKINEGILTLQIDDVTVYIKGIDLIHMQQASFFSLLFYSRVTLKGIVLDASLKSMAPTSLEAVTLSHALWSPRHISLSGHGKFGAFKGDIDLTERKVHIDFVKITDLGVLKRQLKKGKKGWYYETSF